MMSFGNKHNLEATPLQRAVKSEVLVSGLSAFNNTAGP
jgi:hypothetical protein